MTHKTKVRWKIPCEWAWSAVKYATSAVAGTACCAGYIYIWDICKGIEGMRTTLICVVGLQIKSYTNSILQKAAAASATCRHSCLITHTLAHTLRTHAGNLWCLEIGKYLSAGILLLFCFLAHALLVAEAAILLLECRMSCYCLPCSPLLSSPLRLPLPGVSFVHACHACKKKKRRQSAQAARVQATSATKATFKAQLSLNLLLD